MVQVVGILMPFLASSMAYNHYKTHNMFVIIFDFHYKNMKCIWNFVGNSIVVRIIVEYNFELCVLFHYKCTIN
jgi:nuclear transport factor 2 (NTF2) superfamily protein